MLSIFRISVFIASLFAFALLSGCTGSKTAVTHFYVLNPLETGKSLVTDEEKKPLSIEVSSLRLPQYLERPQIVTRSGGNRLKLAEYHQWGGNLRKNMMRVLATNFSQLLNTPHIAIAPYRFPETPDFRVELEVLQFERDSGGHVRLSVQWRLSKGRDGMPVESQITNLTTPSLGDGNNYGTTVSAMSSLYGELSNVLATAILKHHGTATQ